MLKSLKSEKCFYLEDKVFIRQWIHNPPKGVIVIAHGLAEHSKRYVEIGEYLFNKGYSVIALDQKGHGNSRGIPGYVTTTDEYLEYISIAVEYAKSKSPKGCIYLLGHSMGGLCVLNYTMKNPHGIKSVIVSSPCLRFFNKVPKPMAFMANVLAHIYPKASFDTNIPFEYLNHNAQNVQEYLNDPLIFKKVTAGWFAAMNKAMKNALANASSFTLPLLILQGADDRLVDKSAAQLFYQNAGSKQKEYIEYANLYHEILHEECKLEIVDSIISWIEEKKQY